MTLVTHTHIMVYECCSNCNISTERSYIEVVQCKILLVYVYIFSQRIVFMNLLRIA